MLVTAAIGVAKPQIFTKILVNLQAQGFSALGLVVLWH